MVKSAFPKRYCIIYTVNFIAEFQTKNCCVTSERKILFCSLIEKNTNTHSGWPRATNALHSRMLIMLIEFILRVFFTFSFTALPYICNLCCVVLDRQLSSID